MKKLALVMICTLLLVIFIAFNYLLWERQSWAKDMENLKNINIESNAKANSFEKQNSGLYQDIERLNDTIDALTREKDRIENEKKRLEGYVREQEAVLTEKVLLVNRLKAIADKNSLEEPIRKWVEAINNKAYADAFNLMSTEEKDPITRGNTLNEFVESYRSNIKSIDIKEIKMKEEIKEGGGSGEIILEVTLDVIRVEGQENGISPLKQGINKRYFYLGCKQDYNYWIINSIAYAY